MGKRAMVGLIGVALAASAGLSTAWAQDAGKPIELTRPADKPKELVMPTDGKAALAAAAKAMTDAKWISYQAKVEGVGMSGDYTATVTTERAEAGGWKVAVKGELKGKSSTKGRPFEVAFDGASIRSIRESDKQVGELTDPADVEEMMLFFAKERAAAPVTWETLGDKPFAFPDSADIKLETVPDVEGEKFYAVRVTIKDAKPAGEGADAFGGLYTFALKDNMLRKIERFRPNAKATDKPMRTVTFSKVEVAAEPKGGAFVLSVPKGFTVKTQAGKKSMKPAERQSEPKKTAGTGTKVGDTAIAFEGKDLDGGTIKFPGDFKNKIVMVDFWATWCHPCMEEMPHIAEAYDKFASQGLEVLGVSIDGAGDAAKIKSTLKSKKMSWLHIHDTNSAISRLYAVTSIPRAFLVDGDTGVIIAAGNDMRGDALAKTIEKAIKDKQASKK
ncbi:MAG: TlpA family protein disulfide reductase [Tepidisphaera sp.]